MFGTLFLRSNFRIPSHLFSTFFPYTTLNKAKTHEKRAKGTTEFSCRLQHYNVVASLLRCCLKSESKIRKIVFVAQYLTSALQSNGGDSRIEHLMNALDIKLKLCATFNPVAKYFLFI